MDGDDFCALKQGGSQLRTPALEDLEALNNDEDCLKILTQEGNEVLSDVLPDNSMIMASDKYWMIDEHKN